ncbi:Protein of unknown function, partial [Gryllus bimaculatus]
MSGSISDNHNAYFFQSILLFNNPHVIQKITIMEVEPAKLTWLAEAPPAGSNLQLRIWAIDYRRLLDCKSLVNKINNVFSISADCNNAFVIKQQKNS